MLCSHASEHDLRDNLQDLGRCSPEAAVRLALVALESAQGWAFYPDPEDRSRFDEKLEATTHLLAARASLRALCASDLVAGAEPATEHGMA